MVGIDDLIAATYRKDRRALNALLRAGAGINGPDEDGRTPLMHAVLDSAADASFIRHLLEQGASPNLADTAQRWTALHFAAQAQDPEVLVMLIDAGARVDAQDVFGNTPLWRAVMSPLPNMDVIKLLLRAGADPARRNNHGVSPIDLARKRGLVEVEREMPVKPPES